MAEEKSGDGKASALSSSSVVSEKKVGVHPLAIASICDHFTRISVGGSKLARDTPAVGLLFGVQNGLEVSIIDATDAIFTTWRLQVKTSMGALIEASIKNDFQLRETDDAGIRANLDRQGISDVVSYTIKGAWDVTLYADEIEKKRRLWTAVFTNYELLGWYTVGGGKPESWCTSVHRSMLPFNEVPLFVQMNSAVDMNSKHLPLSIFEMETHMVDEKPVSTFVPLDYKLETLQAERIAVDQITKLTPTDGVSTLEVQNQTVITSLRTLESKIDALVRSLKSMQEQGGASDGEQHTLLRKAAKILQQLPAIDSSKFQSSFDNELKDCLMLSYLAAATKTTSSLTDLNDIYSTVFPSVERRRI